MRCSIDIQNYNLHKTHNIIINNNYIYIYIPYSRKYWQELYLADCAKIVENRNWRILIWRFSRFVWWPRRAFPPSASTARACRAPVSRLPRACRPPAARLLRARRPPVARRPPAPVARLPRACRPPVARPSPACRALVARQARDKVLTDIRPSI